MTRSNTTQPTAAEWEAQYARGANDLQQVLIGLAESDLDRSGADGGWSIRQILQHLDASEVWWSFAMKAALMQSGTAFLPGWFPSDAAMDHALQHPQGEAGGELAVLRALRSYIVGHLETIPDARDRFVILNDDKGRPSLQFSVGRMIALGVEHVDGHIADIGRVRSHHRQSPLTTP